MVALPSCQFLNGFLIVKSPCVFSKRSVVKKSSLSSQLHHDNNDKKRTLSPSFGRARRA
jgi:hypothetical protein